MSGSQMDTQREGPRPVSRFRRGLANASWLAIGNLVTQAITLGGFIYIARTLGNEQYGVYATVMAFASMFTMFTFKGLNKVIVRTGSRDLSSLRTLFDRVIGVRLLFLFASMALCILCVQLTPYDTNTRLLIVLYSFHIFYEGMNTFFSGIYQIVEKMQFISVFNITNRTLFVLLAILFLYLGHGVATLIVIAVVVNLVTIAANYIVTRRFVKFNLLSPIRFEREILKPSLSLSLFTMVATLSMRFDLFLISLLGTPVEVGIYAVANRIVKEGHMLKNINSMAFFPVLVKRFDEGRVNGTKMVRYALGFFIGVLLLSTLFTFFSTDLVVLVFGEDYQESGRLLSVLVFYLAAVWGTLPFTIAAQATDNEDLLLKIRTAMAVAGVILKTVCFLLYGLMGVAVCTVIVWTLGGLATCILPYRAMKRQGRLRFGTAAASGAADDQ